MMAGWAETRPGRASRRRRPPSSSASMFCCWRARWARSPCGPGPGRGASCSAPSSSAAGSATGRHGHSRSLLRCGWSLCWPCPYRVHGGQGCSLLGLLLGGADHRAELEQGVADHRQTPQRGEGQRVVRGAIRQPVPRPVCVIIVSRLITCNKVKCNSFSLHGLQFAQQAAVRHETVHGLTQGDGAVVHGQGVRAAVGVDHVGARPCPGARTPDCTTRGRVSRRVGQEVLQAPWMHRSLFSTASAMALRRKRGRFSSSSWAC